MARERMITRTISVTTGIMLCFDADGNMTEKQFELSGVWDSKDALKALRKANEKDGVSVGVIKNLAVSETLYGMPELEFVKYAKIMPSRAATGE